MPPNEAIAERFRGAWLQSDRRHGKDWNDGKTGPGLRTQMYKELDQYIASKRKAVEVEGSPGGLYA